jgi:membrane protein implicated in regulation of membrane protease activity
VDGGLIAAAALGVAEYFTLTLAFGLLAAAALVAAIVAGMGGSLLAQILAFAIAGGVGLLIVRPLARRADDPSCTGAPSAAFAPIHRTTASSPITGQAARLPQSFDHRDGDERAPRIGTATAAGPEPE